VECYYLYGETRNTEDNGVAMAFAKLPLILKTYDSKDVFNFNEIGLYYRALPCKTLNIRHAKENNKKKDYIYIGAYTNVSRKERLKLVFSCKSTRLRCFSRDFSPNSIVHY
jgi:hypothetical protein